MLSRISLFAIAIACLQPLALQASSAAEQTVHVGTVLRGTLVERVFTLENDGPDPLRIVGVELSRGLSIDRLPAVIAPASSIRLGLKLDTRSIKGPWDGQATVRFEGNASASRTFRLKAEVVPPIAVTPRAAFFVAAPKGSARSATLDLFVNEREPVGLELPSSSGLPDDFRLRLKPIEAGRHYRLTLDVAETAPAGRHRSVLELPSTSSLMPTIRVGVNVIVRERVHTFPDSVDMGGIPLAAVKASGGPAPGLAQSLMIYQTGGTDFRVRATTDIPGLNLLVDPGPSGDRAQVTIALDPKRIAAGAIRGRIRLETNDRDFPVVDVPVSGAVLPD